MLQGNVMERQGRARLLAGTRRQPAICSFSFTTVRKSLALLCVILLYSSAFLAEAQTFDPNRVVVIGISGRDGDNDAGGGIAQLIDQLYNRLQSLGVPRTNIVYTQWNPNTWANQNPGGTPDTNTHLNAVYASTGDPVYVAIIGHSYGGWSASLLSRALKQKPNYVALIDPVFGPLGDAEPRINPYGEKIDNWYQRNSISEPPFDCEGTGAVRATPLMGCTANGGISCGRPVDGAINYEVISQQDWDGNTLKRYCDFGLFLRKHEFIPI